MSIEGMDNAHTMGSYDKKGDSTKELKDLSESIHSKELYAILRNLINTLSYNTITHPANTKIRIDPKSNIDTGLEEFIALVDTRESQGKSVESIVELWKNNKETPYFNILLLALCELDINYCVTLFDSYKAVSYKNEVLADIVYYYKYKDIQRFCVRKLVFMGQDSNPFPLDLYTTFVSIYGINALLPMSQILEKGAQGTNIIVSGSNALLDNLQYWADGGALEIGLIPPEREIALKYGEKYPQLIQYITENKSRIKIGNKDILLSSILTPTVVDGILGQITNSGQLTEDQWITAISCFEQTCNELITLTNTKSNGFLLWAEISEENTFTDSNGSVHSQIPFSKNRRRISEYLKKNYSTNTVDDGSYIQPSYNGTFQEENIQMNPVGNYEAFKASILKAITEAKEAGKDLDIIIGLHSIGIEGLHDTLHRNNGAIDHTDFYALSESIKNDPQYKGIKVNLILFSCTTPLDFSKLDGFSSVFLDSSFQNAHSSSYEMMMEISNDLQYDYDGDGVVSFGEARFALMTTYKYSLMPTKFTDSMGKEQTLCVQYGRLGPVLEKIEDNRRNK